MKSMRHIIGLLLIALLFMALIAIIGFALISAFTFINKGTESLNLQEGLTKALLAYIHFIAIFMIFWVAKTLTLIYNIESTTLNLKKRKILYYISAIIISSFISIFLNRVDHYDKNIDFTNAVYYFAVILPCILIGIYYGFLKLSNSTDDERREIKKNIA